MNKLLFFGNEKLASGIVEDGIILRSLIEDGYKITNVFVKRDEKSKGPQEAVLQIAAENNIPYSTTWDEQNILDSIAANGCTHAILAAYGKIIPDTILRVLTIINIHPSLLPRYRGTTPVESALLNNDRETGVSLMKLTSDMDAGPLYAQRTLKISEKTSKQMLATQLTHLGAELLLSELPAILRGKTPHIEQDPKQATYTQPLTKADGRINWDEPASDILQHVRAMAGWPTSYTFLSGKRIVITKAEEIQAQGPAAKPFIHQKKLAFYCSKNAVLVKRLIPAGKKEMDSDAFLRGNPITT